MCSRVSLGLLSMWFCLCVCPSAGSVSILPTVLYLVLGVLRELVHRPANISNGKGNMSAVGLRIGCR